MFSHHSGITRLAGIIVTAVVAACASMLFASSASAGPGGNNGTVKLCSGASCTSANDPHLSCPITIQWSGFDNGKTDTFDVTFTGINPTGGTVSILPGASNTDHDSFTGPDNSKAYSLSIANGTPNKKGEYHVNIDITTQTSNGSDFKSKTVWLQSCQAQNPTQTVTISGSCNANTKAYDWTIDTTPSTAAVSGTYTPQGGVATNYTTDATGTTTFSTGSVNTITSYTVPGGWTAGTAVPVSVTTNNAACTNGGNPKPPSATATSTCSVASVHLSAGDNTTNFSISEPGGTHSVQVLAGQTQDITYTPGPGVTISVSAGNAPLATATSPAACVGPPGGTAAPSASASNACTSGITVVLSNATGTAPATFSVTAPDGTVSTEKLNGGQVKKLIYSVAEDTTGVVKVTAPGLAKTFTYAKDCTQVLGEKRTKHHKKKPPTKVEGEKSQLPFTGFGTRAALFDAACLLGFGAMLCGFGRRRQRAR